MRSMLVVWLVSIAFLMACSPSKEESKAPPVERPGSSSTETAATAATKCEHGVDKALCTRCDPRLEAVFKAKGDWCAEHSRPESQCAICHPELAAAGVK
jgi:hypothetical protein